MREIRLYGSEGGAAQPNALSLPLQNYSECIHPLNFLLKKLELGKQMPIGLTRHGGSGMKYTCCAGKFVL